MRPNWVKIRYEYITTTISYRELAAKYHVSFTTLSKRAKREGWADRRKNNDDKVTDKMLEAFGKEEVKRRQNIMETANVLLDRLDAVLVMQAELDPRDIRILAAALKDIKDCKNCDADIREQEAKIKNLEKQASEENPVVSVEFRMPEGMDDLAE